MVKPVLTFFACGKKQLGALIDKATVSNLQPIVCNCRTATKWGTLRLASLQKQRREQRSGQVAKTDPDDAIDLWSRHHWLKFTKRCRQRLVFFSGNILSSGQRGAARGTHGHSVDRR
jgi:hypothetical protein